jgi:hypothetical protein
MQKTKPILLPLSVGLQAVKSNTHTQNLSTNEMEIQLAVQCKLIKSLYASGVSKVAVVEKKY